MASLQVFKNHGRTYARIVESYRDPVTGKPKVRTLENLGNVEVLERDRPGYLEEIRQQLAENRIDQQNRNTRNRLELVEKLQASPAVHTSVRSQIYGNLVYEVLWNRFTLPYFFRSRKEKTRYTLDVSSITQMLLYGRLLDPDSKKSTFKKREQFVQPTEYDEHQVYRTLDFLAEHKEDLEKHLNRKLQEHRKRNLAVAFYDVTTYYFESVEADTLKKFGYSKDNKVNQVQVVMGLLIDEEGIPIRYELFPGNTGDFRTLIPVMEKLKRDYGITRMILTADRGLNSKSNLAYLKRMNFEYVMAYKIRSSTQALKNQILNAEYTLVHPGFRYQVIPYETSVLLDAERIVLEDHLVLTWSADRAKKDAADRERLVSKARTLAESRSRLKQELQKGGKKYIQTTFYEDVETQVDEERIERDAQWDGYYAIQCSDRSLDAETILSIYSGLWKIEESFRVLKTNLEARPIYLWTEKRIRGHFVLCYLALFLQRYLEAVLRDHGYVYSTEVIQTALKEAAVTIALNQETNQSIYLQHDPSPVFETILSVLNVKDIPASGKLQELKLQ